MVCHPRSTTLLMYKKVSDSQSVVVQSTSHCMRKASEQLARSCDDDGVTTNGRSNHWNRTILPLHNMHTYARSNAIRSHASLQSEPVNVCYIPHAQFWRAPTIDMEIPPPKRKALPDEALRRNLTLAAFNGDAIAIFIRVSMAVVHSSAPLPSAGTVFCLSNTPHHVAILSPR